MYIKIINIQSSDETNMSEIRFSLKNFTPPLDLSGESLNSEPSSEIEHDPLIPSSTLGFNEVFPESERSTTSDTSPLTPKSSIFDRSWDFLGGDSSGYGLNKTFFGKLFGHILSGGAYGHRHWKMAKESSDNSKRTIERRYHKIIGTLEYIPVVGTIVALFDVAIGSAFGSKANAEPLDTKETVRMTQLPDFEGLKRSKLSNGAFSYGFSDWRPKLIKPTQIYLTKDHIFFEILRPFCLESDDTQSIISQDEIKKGFVILAPNPDNRTEYILYKEDTSGGETPYTPLCHTKDNVLKITREGITAGIKIPDTIDEADI